VRGANIGVNTNALSLDDLIKGMSGNRYTGYGDLKNSIKNELLEMLPDRYVNLNSLLNVNFYRNVECSQEFSGTDQVGQNTVIYTKFPLEEFVNSMGSGSGGSFTTITITNIISLGMGYNNGDAVGVGVVLSNDVSSPLAFTMGNVKYGNLSVPLQVENNSYYIGFSSNGVDYYVSKAKHPLGDGMICTIAYDITTFDHVTMEQPGGGEPPKIP
jgi:hypothetical protein